MHFLNRLSDIVSSGTAVIAVLRADQLCGLSVGQPFARLVEQSLHLLAPMTEDPALELTTLSTCRPRADR